MCRAADVINPASLGDADVIAAWQAAGQTCVQVFFIRGGRNNGNRAFFPTHARGGGGAGGAGRLRRAVLRRQAAAAAAAGEPRAAGTGADRRGAGAEGRVAAWRSPSRSAARSTRWWNTPRPTRARRWNASSPKPPARRSCWTAYRDPVRPAGAARTHRGLRQQPHHGHASVRRHDRRRAGGVRQAPPTASSPSAARSRRATISP